MRIGNQYSLFLAAQCLWEGNEILGNTVSHNIQLQQETLYDTKLLRQQNSRKINEKILLRANKNNKLGKKKAI